MFVSDEVCPWQHLFPPLCGAISGLGLHAKLSGGYLTVLRFSIIATAECYLIAYLNSTRHLTVPGTSFQLPLLVAWLVCMLGGQAVAPMGLIPTFAHSQPQCCPDMPS
jgi:hypothetical protein